MNLTGSDSSSLLSLGWWIFSSFLGRHWDYPLPPAMQGVPKSEIRPRPNRFSDYVSHQQFQWFAVPPRLELSPGRQKALTFLQSEQFSFLFWGTSLQERNKQMNTISEEVAQTSPVCDARRGINVAWQAEHPWPGILTAAQEYGIQRKHLWCFTYKGPSFPLLARRYHTKEHILLFVFYFCAQMMFPPRGRPKTLIK